MTRLLYTLKDGYCELIGAEFGNAGELHLKVDNAKDGTLILSERHYRLEDGTVNTDLSSLPDGKLSPSLLINKRLTPLEPFLKKDGKLVPQKTEDFVLRILMKRVSRLEEELEKLATKADELTKDLGACQLIERE